MRTEDTSYNGWKNYETWNVALWIQNDESFYDFARACRRAIHPYGTFVSDLKEMECFQTPDGVAWNDSGLDIEALNKMMEDL